MERIAFRVRVGHGFESPYLVDIFPGKPVLQRAGNGDGLVPVEGENSRFSANRDVGECVDDLRGSLDGHGLFPVPPTQFLDPVEGFPVALMDLVDDAVHPAFGITGLGNIALAGTVGAGLGKIKGPARQVPGSQWPGRRRPIFGLQPGCKHVRAVGEVEKVLAGHERAIPEIRKVSTFAFPSIWGMKKDDR